MKLIFIDFDGVLLPARASFLPGQDLHSPREKAGDDALEDCIEDCGGRLWYPFKRKLDPSAVSLLKRLVDLTGAHLVASTSWKDHPVGGKKVIEDALIEAGFDPHPHWHQDWCTPPSGDLGRGDEIARWLHDHPWPERWVAIDDMPDLPAPGGLTIHPQNGLDLNAYYDALLLLDAFDLKMGLGGWPLWTNHGDISAVKAWLDYAYSAGARFDELWRQKADRETISEKAGLHIARTVTHVLKSDDPWAETDGPAAWKERKAGLLGDKS